MFIYKFLFVNRTLFPDLTSSLVAANSVKIVCRQKLNTSAGGNAIERTRERFITEMTCTYYIYTQMLRLHNTWQWGVFGRNQVEL